jgi:hypothetical protein
MRKASLWCRDWSHVTSNSDIGMSSSARFQTSAQWYGGFLAVLRSARK